MVERIRELCKKQGTSITKLEQSLGFGNGVIGRWGKSKPSYDRVEKVANALNVSVSYLTGEAEQKEIAATLSSDGEKAYAAIFSQLSPANQAKLHELALLYLDAQRKSEEN